MNKQADTTILNLLSTATNFQRVMASAMAGEGPVAAFGLPETNRAHVAAVLGQTRQVLLVTAGADAAMRLQADVQAMGTPCALLLARDLPLTHVVDVDLARRAGRIGALGMLCAGTPCVVVTEMAAVMERLAPKAAFLRGRMTLRPGDDAEPRALLGTLLSAGYERVELCEGHGQVAVRGGILDVWSPDMTAPARIEFWGDTVDQMRLFDPETQRSEGQLTELTISPAYEVVADGVPPKKLLEKLEAARGFDTQLEALRAGRACPGLEILLPLLCGKPATLMDYLAPDALLLLDEPFRLEDAARATETAFRDALKSALEREEGLKEQAALQLPAAEAFEALITAGTVALYGMPRSHPKIAAKDIYESASRPVSRYMGDMKELAGDITRWQSGGEAVDLYAGERAEDLCHRLEEQGVKDLHLTQPFSALALKGSVCIHPETLPRGFCYPELHRMVLGSLELEGREQASRQQRHHRGAPRIDELRPGDYVVHEVHGIGRFIRVETMTVQKVTHDYLLLEYRGGDRLYIPTDQLDRIRRYVGGGDEDSVPQVSKLGGSDWQNKVAKAQASVKKLAVDLAALYSDRLNGKGFAFSPDTEWQKRMEESFPYQETPDQLESIREIKADMERARPMDRLLCGDVGYGKTEVALRAAFKAVQDSKQVAFLVPTTILAQQHYNTAMARLNDFPVRVACLSRFTPPKERAALKKRIAAGEIDIIIGTHALLAKDVTYHDLGLLIIDEEQRFGVNHKEKLKELRHGVDVLTLTATPIPRTLNMSMTGVRDISVIDTPPESRYPVQTAVVEYTDQLVVDAVSRELARGGQAYIVYNRVYNMEAYVDDLRRLLPEARIMMAHGQMPEEMLEKAMLSFMDHEADVLVCSTIIESGLDIPNVNTMIVVEAERMGLAQLYQLRGRVGRSTRIGYAYLTVPRGAAMNEQAAKRLAAIREFTDFGSGFRLAMRDLEIRGAGSLLGAEQHGHIADVGYDYYCKLMRRAMAEVKGEADAVERDVTVDAPVSAYIPKEYIPVELQRLGAYRRITGAGTEMAQQDVRDELEDRYGELPRDVENLLLLARIRHLAARAGIAAATVREGEAELSFFPDAAIDGGRLLMAVSAVQGGRLVAGEVPGIRIRQPGKAPQAMLEMLPQFLNTIVSCSDTMDGYNG